MEIIKFDPKDYSKCTMCGNMFLSSELFLCDGIIGKRRLLPFGKLEDRTCDKLICKECKKSTAGYDFCNECYERRVNEIIH